MLTLDTSAVIALVNQDDPDYERVALSLASDPGPLLMPAGILAECAYMLERTLGLEALDAVLEDLAVGSYTLDCGANDFQRIRWLIGRYADLRLGFSDSAVIACAERNGGRVLTLDRRHFDVVSRELSGMTVLP
jgi:predicted nucleic acid-binding protein